MQQLLEDCVQLARQAGAAVMEIYESDDFGVELKSDNTPLTKADMASHRIIKAGLTQLTDYPVVSEEGSRIPDTAEKFWLVDPIDGTKEFIKRNGEFTVNIGLIEGGQPVLGVVYAPAKGILYAGAAGLGSYKISDDGTKTNITANFTGDIPMAVVSRSHRDDKVEEFLKKLGQHDAISMGSSLKLCLVAEGKAAVYPRFAPTSLWDTAAADAVVRAAGGTVTNLENQPLTYNPNQEILNPYFIVSTAGQQYAELLQ